jgi:orotate phosphoribosyltransferase
MITREQLARHIYDRESGGAKRLADIGLALLPLFRASDLKAAVQDMKVSPTT